MPAIGLVPSPVLRALHFAWLPYLLLLLWVLFWPSPPSPPGGSDKAGHLLLFLVLAVVVYMALWTLAPWRRFLVTAGLGIGFGVASEFVQALVPGRAFELADMGANVMGVAVGLGLVLLYRRLASGSAAPELTRQGP